MCYLTFINFDYNEFNLGTSVESIEMQIGNVIEIVLAPYQYENDSISPSDLETPPCTPCSVIEEVEEYDEEELDDGLLLFTDTCSETLLRPTPIYPQLNTEQELRLALPR